MCTKKHRNKVIKLNIKYDLKPPPVIHELDCPSGMLYVIGINNTKDLVTTTIINQEEVNIVKKKRSSLNQLLFALTY